MTNSRKSKYDIPAMPAKVSEYRQQLWTKVWMIGQDTEKNEEDIRGLKRDRTVIMSVGSATALVVLLFSRLKVLFTSLFH